MQPAVSLFSFLFLSFHWENVRRKIVVSFSRSLGSRPLRDIVQHLFPHGAYARGKLAVRIAWQLGEATAFDIHIHINNYYLRISNHAWNGGMQSENVFFGTSGGFVLFGDKTAKWHIKGMTKNTRSFRPLLCSRWHERGGPCVSAFPSAAHCVRPFQVQNIPCSAVLILLCSRPEL